MALSEWPWLSVHFGGAPPAGRWIRLCFAASLLEPLARPVVRCFTANGHHDEILPGALFGRAIWYGFIPHGTKEIWISPTNRKGPFGFAIENITQMTNGEAVRLCLWRNPHHAIVGLAAEAVGLSYAASVKFHRSISATRLNKYRAWRKARLRELDVTGIDTPRFSWERGPQIRFLVGAEQQETEELRRLAGELAAQPYPHWTLTAAIPSKTCGSLAEDRELAGGRVAVADFGSNIKALLTGLSDSDLIAPMAPHDCMPAYALAVIAEAACQNPSADLFYGDEEFIDDKGRHAELRLRPDWSPALWTACPQSFLGAALFFRARILKRLDGSLPPIELSRMPGVAAAKAVSEDARVFHIRRVLRTCAGPAPRQMPRQERGSSGSRARARSVSSPCATIIIPTKDRCDLLTRCVESLKRKTAAQDLDVIVIDNGSEQASAQRYLAGLARDPRFRVLTKPGPFNFSRLCNEAAARAKAATLVFLNNDTEIIEEHWLDPLLYWASQDDVGAVGAKLLYPSGCVQHAGVLLGIDGRAGHFERTVKKDDPGYFGRLCVPHEVSAVTAACLAMEKKKFDAVGGFDEINLPIELNDIDLCLRLLERGFRVICAADCVLIHHESASRGRTARADEIYSKERRYFRARWMHYLRDDCYFHPALSLHSLAPALS